MMLWDPGSSEKEGEEELSTAITPILVPLQNNPPPDERGIPLLVPDVEGLKDQFQQQQNMLTQIKETLKKNESQLSSRGKQVEVYANKLSQIRARSKNTQKKKTNTSDQSKVVPPKFSQEIIDKLDSTDSVMSLDNNSKVGRRGKISELKKGLEENKIKFEQRTGKEQSETKKIETLVEHLKTQVEERDKTIQDLQKNLEKPSLPKKIKLDKDFVASKFTQTHPSQASEESNEILSLKSKIFELEANVLDLEENLKEKESVIEARTQAVTLLSQDLSLKGKHAIENLEETRQEMRVMQNNFIAIEDQLKKDVSDRDNRLSELNEKNKKLTSANFDLSLKNAELQEKLVKLQEKYAETELEYVTLKESKNQGQSNDDLVELSEKVKNLSKELDERNKTMIKMKIEHKNKLKSLNKTLETLKETSDDKAEIVRLSNSLEEYKIIKVGLENRVAELEDEKGNLLLSVLDVDDLKVLEKQLKDRINELETVVNKQNEEISSHLYTISNLEQKNLEIIEINRNQNSVIENLRAKVGDLDKGIEGAKGDQESKLKKINQDLEDMERKYEKKIENLKEEHAKELEKVESFFISKAENADRKELEEYRISTEISNIHVEEQIELLIREKQQLLEKLKNLSGVSSTDSLIFEKMEHSDLKDDSGSGLQQPLVIDLADELNGQSRISHLQRIVNDQQSFINDLQKTVESYKEKTVGYERKIKQLEASVSETEEAYTAYKQQIETSEITVDGKNQKSNFNAKNKFKKIEMELTQAKKTISEQADKLKDLSEKVEEKEDLIKKYTEKIELFEKDDWDRQNHWQNIGDDFIDVQELQKKCLSLENNLIEVSEDCERLRKENIEVVHRLSEEKVKRKKLLEELKGKAKLSDIQANFTGFEDRINALNEIIKNLEEKVKNLESSSQIQQPSNNVEEENGKFIAEEVQQKLEWANVVLTSKETEIFRLQNSLQDHSKIIENLEADLNIYKTALAEKEQKCFKMIEDLEAKDLQLQEISAKFNKLQETANSAQKKIEENELQLQELMYTVKEMETNVCNKESELKEIKTVLSEKNVEVSNLKNRLEEVNTNLTHSYKEHLENIGKCLKDKELEFDKLVVEKQHLEDLQKLLVSEKEEIYNKKIEIANENEKLRQALLEKETAVTELNEKLKDQESITKGRKDSSQEIEDMKIKMKKLAANLKKKVQNEADLLKQVKDLEGVVVEKDKIVENLNSALNEVTEKWTTEKNEKVKILNELSDSTVDKTTLENENAAIRDQFKNLQMELESNRIMHESQVSQMEAEIQKVYETCNDFQMIEQQYKDKILDLEAKLNEVSQLYQNATITAKENEIEIKEEKIGLDKALQELAEVKGEYEELKQKCDLLECEKFENEKKLEELEKLYESTMSVTTTVNPERTEDLVVIENLKAELEKAQEHLKYVEEKFCISEERRLSLETQNEDLCKKAVLDSQNMINVESLSSRVEDLLKREKNLQSVVKNLEMRNSVMKEELDKSESDKLNLEKEINSLSEKTATMTKELKQLKDSNNEKNGLVNTLTQEIEKLKFGLVSSPEESENFGHSSKKSKEMANENKAMSEKSFISTEGADVEVQIKSSEVENTDNKRKKKKSVTFKTDEVDYIKDLKSQLHRFDDDLKRANQEISDLKKELLREKLKNEVSSVVTEAQEKVKALNPVAPTVPVPVVEPALEKAEIATLEVKNAVQGENIFDANLFFGKKIQENVTESSLFDQSKVTQSEDPSQSSEFDSLTWDDGWEADGQLEEEYLSTKASEIFFKPGSDVEIKIKSLESEVERLIGEIENLKKELKDQTAKYAKALKKLKEQKLSCDKLQTELNKRKSSSGFGDLDAAIVDELKVQIEALEKKEKELLKNLEISKLEKDSLLKRIDVLNAGNEKFLEMKERQDNEAEIWQKKNNELLKEISEMRKQMSEPQVVDEDSIRLENKELKNKIEALEWKNSELTQLLEEKQEMLEENSENSSAVHKVMEEKSHLQKEIEELNNVKELLEKRLFDEEKRNSTAIGELNEQLTALATENETLQDILGRMKKSNNVLKPEAPKESKIFDYFKSSPANDFFSFTVSQETPQIVPQTIPTVQVPHNIPQVVPQTDTNSVKEVEVENMISKISELEELLTLKQSEISSESQKIFELEKLLRVKEEELNASRNNFCEVETLNCKVVELEENLRKRNEEILILKDSNSRLEKEIEKLNLILVEIESGKEGEINNLKQKYIELENILKIRDDELFQLKKKGEDGLVVAKNVVTQLASPSQFDPKKFDTFESVDLTRDNNEFLQSEDEMEALRQRVFQVEHCLRLKDEELQRLQTISSENNTNEIELLRQRVFQLEDILRLKDDELKHLQAISWSQDNINETKALKEKIKEMEDFIKFKEDELQGFVKFKEDEVLQIRLDHSNEIQELNLRIFNLESLLKEKEALQEEGVQKKISNLENEARLREEEFLRIQSEQSNEVDTLKQMVLELESLLSQKDEEINQLMARLTDLEKSYNDSKVEIERLLNEEKLNTEEKFVEPFQKNIQIPVEFELEAISRSLNEEKQKAQNLQYTLSDKDNSLQQKSEEVDALNKKVIELEKKLRELADEENIQKLITDESFEAKSQLEKMVADLQRELENSNLQLSVTRRELEEVNSTKDENLSSLKSQVSELELTLVESIEKKDYEISELKSELNEKVNFYEKIIELKNQEEVELKEKILTLEKCQKNLEKEVDMLKAELISKVEDINSLDGMINDEKARLSEVNGVLEKRELEVEDLRQTLKHLHVEISHFRNFEKQVKDLRAAQIRESGSELPVNEEGDPDLSDWSEHELAELSSRLQSDLDTALYMLHQRDVRCDELTFELMQLLEERDTLQLRLSTALRINEQLRSVGQVDSFSSIENSQENKDLVDQSNDRQKDQTRVPTEDLNELAHKISELHSVSYLRDKTVKDDSLQRHNDQMNLLSRISDSDVTMSREVQSSPAVLLNWVRGKTTPKVMHI